MARMGATQAKLAPGNKNMGAAGFYSSTMYVSQNSCFEIISGYTSIAAPCMISREPAFEMFFGAAFRVATPKDKAKIIPDFYSSIMYVFFKSPP